ncbi:YnfA family protein [Patescibacteria group bacterium]|nr:YnfA family protein [Patescibacteria group bacterium]
MKLAVITKTIFYFVLAGLLEIGGGYLVWLWIREDYAFYVGLLGGFVLFLYGIVPTLQPSHFHRIYATYGGIFIVMALLWGWIFDGIAPDRFDVIGALIALIGVAIIFYWPRKNERLWQT